MPVYNYTAIDDPSQVGLTTSAAGISLSMEGRIGTNTKTNKMFYTEILFKKVKGKPVAQLLIDSTCHQIAPPAV